MSAQLQFYKIAADRPFHAALVAQRGSSGERVQLHTHDFWELMYVVKGNGFHWLGKKRYPLGSGDLLLIRPKDVHAIQVQTGQNLHFLNVAFLERSWQDFCSVTQLTLHLGHWAAAEQPCSVNVPAEAREGCVGAFQGALQAFVETPSYLDLCRFWSIVLPLFLEPPRHPETVPLWLVRARQKMQDEPNLQIGLPRLNALCGVSQGHLARTFRNHYHQTPTEFINELRLKRAATLLTTTSTAIVDIAADCGFNNLSYFYRRFADRFGDAPKSFRLKASRQIMLS